MTGHTPYDLAPEIVSLKRDHSDRNGNGAQGRDRTTDTAIFSRMLYQLSYLGGAVSERGRL